MRAHFPNNPRAPLVLVYDFAALLDLSGVRPKLPTVKHGLPLSRQTCATRQHKRGIKGFFQNSDSSPYALDAKPSIANMTGIAR
jgi:hypothetical protein